MAQNSLTEEMLRAANTIIEPGDVFFAKSHTFLGKSIRFFSRPLFQPPVETNHTGIFTEYGRLRDVEDIEASYISREHSFWGNYCGKNIEICIYRCNDLPYNTRLELAKSALKFEGHVYGFGKIILHALDWPLFGLRVFRRLSFIDAFPICSLEVAHPYADTLGYRFGMRPEEVNPDNMLDWIKAHPKKWSLVLDWTKF
jgi:hypothetical protein